MRLHAPKGATSCNVNGQDLPVGEDGTVEVPDEFATELFAHGYVVPGAEVPDQEDTVAQLLAKLEQATAELEKANASFRDQSAKLAQVQAELAQAREEIGVLTDKLEQATAKIAELSAASGSAKARR